MNDKYQLLLWEETKLRELFKQDRRSYGEKADILSERWKAREAIDEFLAIKHKNDVQVGQHIDNNKKKYKKELV